MTFSLVGHDPISGSIGMAVSTAAAAVGARVPHGDATLGLIATQGKTNVRYGTLGLRLMELGFTPREALETLLGQDKNSGYRQVLMTNLTGDWVVHTGEHTENWHGHLCKPHAVALGNTLRGKEILEAMVDTFETTQGDLARRLMVGLTAGQDMGGDREGKCSAAIVVLNPRAFEPWGSRLDLRVDFDPNPVYRLAEVLGNYLEWEERRARNIDPRIYSFSNTSDGATRSAPNT